MVAAEDDEEEVAVAKFREAFRSQGDSGSRALLVGSGRNICTPGIEGQSARLQAAHIDKEGKKKATWVDDSDEDETGGAAYVSLDLDDIGII